jgi:DNA-binding CsgD family transcriptional regulator
VIAAITHEVESLGQEEGSVLEAAAIAGESFDPGLVATIVERDEQEVLRALDKLVSVDLIRQTAVPRTFRFRHPIVRRVVYDAMPAGWRIGAHARAAAALDAARAPKAEFAHHVARSASVGDEAAIALLVEAARDAAARAPLTGGRWLSAAVRLLPGDDVDRRVRLLSEAGGLLTSGGGFGEALESLEEALSLAPADEVVLRARLVAQRAEARRRGGRPFGSRAQLEEALQSLSERDVPTALAVSLELAMNRYWHGDLGRVHELAGEVLATARAQEDDLLVCLAASLSSLASSGRCDPESALGELREAQTAIAALPDERFAERIYLTHYISEAALRLERADEALSHFNRGLDVARMTGQDATSSSWSAIAAYALLLKGQVEEAASITKDDFDPGALAADSFRMIILLLADALTAFWQGRNERMLELARELVTRSERAHSKTNFPALARIRLGAALLATGDAAGASKELRSLDDDARRWLLDLDSAHGWDMLIRAQLALGEFESAADFATRAASRVAHLPQHLATIRCVQAALLGATGEHEAAADVAARAVELAEPTGNPLLSGRCRAQYGAGLAAAGGREQGISELSQAQEALVECGAVREADAAARELRRLGGRVRRRTRPDRGAGLTELSPREREVAEEVAAGKTNRDIAATLFLSEKTIESHLARIYSKLDVHSRAALTAIVARQGTAAGSNDSSAKATVP